ALTVEFNGCYGLLPLSAAPYPDALAQMVPAVPSLRTLDVGLHCRFATTSMGLAAAPVDHLFANDTGLETGLSLAVLTSISPAAFPNLASLRLRHLLVSSQHLLAALQALSPRLRSLYLYHLAIPKDRGSWVEVLRGLKHNLRLDEFGLDRLPGQKIQAREDGVRKIGGSVFKGLNGRIERYVRAEECGDPLEDVSDQESTGLWRDVGVAVSPPQT
ncbi:MAG: hypothetical protein Q9210_007495, partial [Variospora velana]